ncbi:hypothetical protein JW859_04390 [bacterium]|nr:hypothetical protein [bacterium]
MSDDKQKGADRAGEGQPEAGGTERERAGTREAQEAGDTWHDDTTGAPTHDEYSHRHIEDEEDCCLPPHGGSRHRQAAHHRHHHGRHHGMHHGMHHGHGRGGSGCGPVTVQINLMLPEQMLQALAQCCHRPEDCFDQPMDDCCTGESMVR